MRRLNRYFGVLAALVGLAPLALGASPYSLSYGGRLADALGAPVPGPVDLKIKFFDAATGGSQLGSEVDDQAVGLSDGVFQAPIVLDGATVQAIFGANEQVFIEVTDATHGQTYPRQSFSAVPYALRVPVDQATITYDGNGNLTLTNPDPLPVSGNGAFTTPIGLEVLASDPTTLTAADAGKMWYNGGIKYWNGTSAQLLGVSGGGLQSLNGITDNTQTLAVGIGGTSPTWVDAGSSHTLTLPMTSTTGAAAGLLANGDWVAFNSKVSSQWTNTGSGVLYSGGSVGIGATGAAVLDISGTGTTAASTSLSVTDGAGQNTLSVSDDGTVSVGSGPFGKGTLSVSTGTTSPSNFNASSVTVFPNPSGANTGQYNTQFLFMQYIGGSNSGHVYGSAVNVYDSSGGTVGSLGGAAIVAQNVFSGTVTSVYGETIQVGLGGAALGMVGTAYGLDVLPPTIGLGSMGTYYGVYIGKPTAATTNYSVFSEGGTNFFGGSVGIGSSTPSASLDVAGTFRMHDGTQASGRVLTSDANGNATWQAPASGIITNYSGQSLDNVGQLSIGTTAPGADVFFAAGADRTIAIGDQSAGGNNLTIAAGGSTVTGDNGGNLVLAAGATSGAGGSSQIQLQTSSGGTTTDAVTILGNGNVGIGTSSPTARLQINGSGNTSATTSFNVMGADGDVRLSIRDDGFIYTGGPAGGGSNFTAGLISTGQTGYRMLDASANYFYVIGGSNNTVTLSTPSASGDLILDVNNGTGSQRTYTNGAERMRIDSNGNVGIGTTSPSGTLDVEGGTAAAGTAGAPVRIVAQNAGGGILSKTGGSIILQPGTGNNGGANGGVGIGTTSPNATLQVAGPIATAITTVTSTYSVASTDSVVFADASGGAFDVTLPTAIGVPGVRYTIKKQDSSANAVTVRTVGAPTVKIDGATFYGLSTQYEYVDVVSDGSNWNIVGGN